MRKIIILFGLLATMSLSAFCQYDTSRVSLSFIAGASSGYVGRVNNTTEVTNDSYPFILETLNYGIAFGGNQLIFSLGSSCWVRFDSLYKNLGIPKHGLDRFGLTSGRFGIKYFPLRDDKQINPFADFTFEVFWPKFSQKKSIKYYPAGNVPVTLDWKLRLSQISLYAGIDVKILDNLFFNLAAGGSFNSFEFFLDNDADAHPDKISANKFGLQVLAGLRYNLSDFFYKDEKAEEKKDEN